MSDHDREHVARRIDDWRRRLIDLTFRNRLIKYRPTTATTLQVAAPSLAELIADPGRSAPWRFYFPPESRDDELDESDTASSLDDAVLKAAHTSDRPRKPDEIEVAERNPKRISRILDNLAKKANSEFQDKAVRVLYIAAGFLDWVDPTRDERLSSPLVLVPVELRRPSTAKPYELFFVGYEDVVINPSLTEKLHRDAGLHMPEDWLWEDKPISVSRRGRRRQRDCAVRDPPRRLRPQPERDRPAGRRPPLPAPAARDRRPDAAQRSAGLPRCGDRAAASPGRAPDPDRLQIRFERDPRRPQEERPLPIR
jgi:Protein of unknown function (DUF4011)